MGRYCSSLMLSLTWFLATAKAHAATNLKDCLLESVGGETVRAKFSNDADFQADHIRPYNLNFQYVPFAILYPNSPSEVAGIVVCASQHDRKVQARSGGHDYTNKGIGGNNGAVVVDMKNLNHVQLGSDGIAKVGSGNRLKDVCEKLHANGKRWMPHGSSPTVGIGGHATVGGLGLHSRLLGTSLDVMVGAEVVLANGTIATVSETHHPDVFWAVRGAGASFGIATSFWFRTQTEPDAVVNFIFTIRSSDPTKLSDAFKAYHEITVNRSLDPRLSSAAIILKDTLQISGVFFGTELEYNKVNFSRLITGITEQNSITNLTWMGHMNRTFDTISNIFPAQSYFYVKDTAVAYSTLPSNDTIDAVFEHLQSTDSGSKSWFVLVDLYGGAVNDVASGATAFPHRNLAYFFAVYAQTKSTTATITHDFVDNAVLKYQRNEPEKYLSYAGYTNLRIKGIPQQHYWGDNLPRLEKIKSAVDPGDLFSTPQGIKPRA
ncbi:FAD binding domain-containing protein [Colletotrichum fioriniae PJ7]|uniref:FAD binding domain-containing protein n=1 Tax=Colletotrichum fioriniae PJ7 TaxID=1445577 RepID=A0A010SLD3_9PEZI|nr:FAD binding domain-containing protein [Colletotrichum fioriniae PJ7]